MVSGQNLGIRQTGAVVRSGPKAGYLLLAVCVALRVPRGSPALPLLLPAALTCAGVPCRAASQSERGREGTLLRCVQCPSLAPAARHVDPAQYKYYVRPQATPCHLLHCVDIADTIQLRASLHCCHVCLTLMKKSPLVGWGRADGTGE